MSPASSTMRIGFVVGEFPRASQRFIVNQVTGLLDRGHDVRIYSTGEPTDDDRAVTDIDLSEHTVYTPMPTNRTRRLARATSLLVTGIRRSPAQTVQVSNPLDFGREALSLRPLYRLVPMLGESFDIVHAHFGPNARTAAVLKAVGVADSLVATFHGFGVRQARNHPEWYEHLFATGDAFLANSRYTYDQLVALGVDETKLHHHPNYIDVANFPFRWSTDPHNVPNPLKLVTVARLEPIKGIEYALEAVAQLTESLDVDVEYRIIGDGSQREDLEALATNLGIGDSVVFHGHTHRQRVIETLLDSHIFVLPSLEEAFGMVLLEAQAVGLPIVASNVGGIPEAVSGRNGARLVPTRDPDAIAGAIREWTDQVDNWPTAGKRSREVVERQFGSDALLEELSQIYTSVYPTVHGNDRAGESD